MKTYVVGFVFDMLRTKVALIKKKRPQWQRGKWNGIGGKIEPGETPLAAMEREFEEETGVKVRTEDWEQFIVLKGFDWEVYFFRGCPPTGTYYVKTVTDEEVSYHPVNKLPCNALENLRWLLPMALDSNVYAGELFDRVDQP